MVLYGRHEVSHLLELEMRRGVVSLLERERRPWSDPVLDRGEGVSIAPSLGWRIGMGFTYSRILWEALAVNHRGAGNKHRHDSLLELEGRYDHGSLLQMKMRRRFGPFPGAGREVWSWPSSGAAGKVRLAPSWSGGEVVELAPFLRWEGSMVTAPSWS